MASPVTPKGRGALYTQKADRLGAGEPLHGESGDSQGSGCTSRRCYQLRSIHRPAACGTHAMTAVLNLNRLYPADCTGSVRECRRMASRTTPKGRVHLEGVAPHGEPNDSQGSCAPPIADSRRNRGRFLL